MKVLKKLFIFLTIFIFLFIIKVDAATLSVSGSASSTSTTVGNSFTITFKYSSSNYLGAVVYSMNYDSTKLTLTSGLQSNAISYTGNQKSDTVKYTFKAKESGTTTITFNINEALDFDGNTLQAGSTSKTITIKTQKEVEESYSKNNNLSSLSIENVELSPKFNKNTTTYSASVANDVTKISIKGSKEDSKSSIEGLKEYELEEGLNVIEVKVTAQNGSSKKYTINITREELEPIVVQIGEEEKTVVRKKEVLESPNNSFEETTIEIDGKEIPAYYNEATKTYLVGLKDSDGKVNLYKYDNGNYIEYKEIAFNSIIINIAKPNNIPDDFVEEKITINDEEVIAYKNSENEIIINGINIKTGKENLYKYDKDENTLQIYNNNLLTKIGDLNNDKNNYMYIIIGLGSLLIITYIVILASTLNKGKNKNKNKKIKKKKSFFFEEVETEEKEDNDNKNNDNNKDEIEIKIEDNNDNELLNEKTIELDDSLQSIEEKKNEDLEEIEINSKKSDRIKEDVSKKRKTNKK